jgi:hypothetical protein
MIPKELILLEAEKLVKQTKISLNEIKTVALDQAWKILQLATVNTIQIIEDKDPNLAGKDKKTIALEFLSRFYDTVFIVVDIPFVPNIIEPIIRKSIKSILMILIGSTIDAMVITFRQTGVFVDSKNTVDPDIDNQPKVSEK